MGEHSLLIQLDQLIAAITDKQLRGATNLPIAGLAYDSRQVVPNGLFVAIAGFHTDGHYYIPQALAQGATAIVGDARFWDATLEQATQHVTRVLVPDSRVALATLASAFYGYPAHQLGVVGITGTKGKSTTTDLVSRVLEGGGFTTGMIGTVDFKVATRRWANDTRQSTPEAPEVQALLREMVANGCAYAVIEATSHALSARWNRLGGCAFDVALFLNITHEHLDFHGNFAQYRHDKARLFALLGAEPPNATLPHKAQKWAIVNADDPSHQVFLDAAPPTAQRLTYALHAPADLRALHIEASPNGSLVHVATPWGERTIQLALAGTFNVANALAALSVALCQGIPLETAASALESAPALRGRMERVVLGQPFTVIVDYAHNPDSFEQVLRMLRPLTQGRMIALFGSAGERDREKRPIQGQIAARYCDLLVLSDEDPRGEDPLAIIDAIAAGVEATERTPPCPYTRIPDRAQAIRYALAEARPGDLVLLLGKGHEGSIIYAGYSRTWNEAEEARQALSELGYTSR